MPNSMEHERQRWSYMTTEKLLTRLRRIKDYTKLTNFSTLAMENGNYRLMLAAHHRHTELGYMVPFNLDHAVIEYQERQAQRAPDLINERQATPEPPTIQENAQKRTGPRVRVLKGL